MTVNGILGDERVGYTFELSGNMCIKCSIYRNDDDIFLLMPVIKSKTKQISRLDIYRIYSHDSRSM